MKKLNDKIAIVTGGASGLGKAVAEKFSENGAKVAILDINIELGGKVADEINKKGGDAIAVECNVSNEKDVDEAFASVLEKYKRIDIAHINAGIEDKRQFINETSFEDWRKVISVNLDGVFLTARNTIKQMLKQSGGTIVFTGSNWAYVCEPGFTSYAASKGGVVSFARALALDHAKDNIRINLVCPGNMYTPLLEEQLRLEKNPEEFLKSMGQISKPEEVANLVLFLASDDSSAMKGSAVIIDQGETLAYGPGLSVKKN